MKTNETNSTLLSIIILGILIIPIIGLDYVDDNTKEEILQYGLTNYEYENLDYVCFCQTTINEQLDPHDLHTITWTDNATVLGYAEHGIGLYDLEWGDNVTYIGNDTYLIDIDEFTYTHIIFISLNVTAWNLTNYDTLFVTSNIPNEIVYFDTLSDDNLENIEWVDLGNDESLYYLTITDKINLLASPDYNMMLIFDAPLQNIEYKIQIGERVNESAFTLSDMTQYYIILTSSIAISIFTLVFMTNIIDIVIDKKKKQ